MDGVIVPEERMNETARAIGRGVCLCYMYFSRSQRIHYRSKAWGRKYLIMFLIEVSYAVLFCFYCI